MRRLIAILLTGCLAFQTWTAAAVPASAGSRKEKNAVESSENSNRESVSQTESGLEVEIRSSRLFPFQGKATVQIRGGEVEESKELQFSGSDSTSESQRFDVPQGDYTVTIKSDKFADYKQKVQVSKGWVSKIQVWAARYENGRGASPGWIRQGDINGDGVIDQKDTELMLSAVREDPKKNDTDLNMDGNTDLVDLQNLVQGIDEKQESNIEKLALLRKVQTVGGTTVEGSMEAFLSRSEGIVLKPSNAGAAISADNPVALEFTLAEDGAQDTEDIPKIQGIAIHAPMKAEEGEDVSSEIVDGEAQVVAVDEKGNEQELTLPLASESKQSMSLRAYSADPKVHVDADGSLILDFGTQIAVKRVTIKITGTKKTEPLVNLAKVEFVNNMEDRIAPPNLDIPTLNAPVSENKALTVSWDAQTNITGYEVYVSGPVKGQAENETQIIRVSGTVHTISGINDKELINFEKYKIKVRSVNGDWKSPWSNEQTGIPKPQKLPAPPDYVKAEGGYRSISVSWKDMEDAAGYMVYYKKSTDTEFVPVVKDFQPVQAGTGKLEDARYVISGLEDNVEYSVYVISWNELGWGKASLVSSAVTKDDSPPQLPTYKLLNTSKGEGVLSDHIVNATIGGSGGAKMVSSPLDTSAGSALGLVDNNFGSYWIKSDWDDGVAYPSLGKGMIITLDDDYPMNYITFAAADQKTSVDVVRIGYWNKENPDKEQIVNARLIQKKDENNNPYYIVKFDGAITANKIHMCLGRSWGGSGDLMVGEIHFHKYDSLEDDIMKLYEDEMHTTLRKDVTEAVIAALEERLNRIDEESGEKHPLFQELTLEIKTAREILNSKLDPSLRVENRITGQKDKHLGFGGLNPWQPLGKAAYAGETLLVYVGHNTKRTGDSTNLQLIVTQHHAEADSLAKGINLKIGRNEITVPQLTSNTFERGGQLYIAYTGNNSSDQYAVRISGGSSIPVLSVYGKTGSERTEAISAYVKQLESYVNTIQPGHDEKHTGTKNVDYDYDVTNCILNATDIMMKDMMYSVPATQVWAAIKNAEDKTEKLDNSLKAMEDTMTLFYQHKGLSDDAGTKRGNNALPAQHLNIRYMRMFAGAFMYAAGNHIGVEWGSTTLAGGPNDWSGFGWGVAHEIGHNINQGTYAVAEITNNYFAQLLTKTPGKTRFQYPKVYEKVTSGTIGRSSNVSTQLALYWQLHLAFDNQTDDRHIFDDYEEQFNNLFFARVDTYSRNPDKAPQSGLSLKGGTDQNLMRLACAAANKNILQFFQRCGMVPDEETKAYAQKYGEAETKALYYVNDDARDYRAAHTGEEGTILNQDVVTAAVAAKSNQVEVTIATEQNKDLILGYEILRSMTSNGKKETKVVGFQPIDTAQNTVYVDSISSINNRVMEYEVRAVDKYLNYSNSAQAGSVKIQTDGVLDKTEWTVETTMTSEDDVAIDSDIEDPDSGYHAEDPGSIGEKKVHSIDRILDQDRTEAGTYHGISEGNAVITIDMHKTEQVTALKYQGDALTGMTIEVSPDGSAWTVVKEGYTGLFGTGEQTVWFDSVKEDLRDSWIGTYDARYVKMTIPQSGEIAIQEIEICGPSGDNLEFMEAEENTPAVGVLTADYKYGSQDSDVIKKGSLIFTGTYKGNPAYNVVVLYDTEGNVIGAKEDAVQAGQVIFADVPEQGNLGETSNGTWVYYVEPGQSDAASLQKIKGVRGELYRVDDALTLEGERIVSDTQIIQLPDSLPDITLTGSKYGS